MAQVSVVLPTFNRLPLLSRAVDSVLSQKEISFELFVVDDGSTDGTAEYLQQFEKDSRVKVIKQKNQGVSCARNAGAEEAQCDYLAFIDSDDEWKPGKLAAQFQFLEETLLGICQTEEIWMRNGVRVNPPDYLRKKGGNIFAESLERCFITPSSVMLRSRVFEDSGGFDESLPACEDYDLWLKLASAYPVGLLPGYFLIRYAGHGDQLSAKYPAMDKFRLLSLVKRIKEGCFLTSQKSMALRVLEDKLRVYQGGCEKRGREEELVWCAKVGQFVAEQKEKNL